MFAKLTTLLCASLYVSMLILGTDPSDDYDVAPVSARGDFSPSQLSPVIPAQDNGDAQLISAAFTVEDVQPTAALAKPETTPSLQAPVGEQDAADSGMLRYSAWDAPQEVLATVAHDKGIDVVEVTGSVVNLRAGPSTKTDVVARLARGERAEIVADAGDGWMQIRDLNSGAEGYMSADFLSPVTPG